MKHVPDAEEMPGDPGAVWKGWAVPEEVDTFDEFVRRFWSKELSEDEFKAFRLQNGVYGQSQPGLQMVRVKVPAGGLTAEQLSTLADLAEKTQRGVAHVTTRQNIQFHFVPLAEATAFLEKVNAVGLTSREACSNTVRNVTSCHRAGVCRGEPFDVSPYAAAAASFFLRNPICQAMPRKFKISFSGCSSDCGMPLLHDVGAVAKLVAGPDGIEKRGFELYLGGGLGAQPREARLLEPFTPEEDLLVTLAAVVRVFDREGDREQKMKARMKYVVERLGWEAFRDLVLKDRAKLKLAAPMMFPKLDVWSEGPAQAPQAVEGSAPSDARAYERWLAASVEPQRQDGYALVHVRLPLGDVTAAQLRAVADVVKRFSNGTARTTIQQNLALRWIPTAALPDVYALLAAAGVAKPGAERLADVTSCPGADTCQIGITSSRGLARELTKRLGEGPHADLEGVRVKISGCPNSCGQHHVAPIGLFGGAKTFDGHLAPTYQLMIGAGGAGSAAAGKAFGRAFLKIPAANAPEAVERLVQRYAQERKPGETFGGFVERYGLDALKAELEDLTRLPPYDQAPEKYRDVASAQEEIAGQRDTFIIKTGKGECAS